MSVRRVDLRSGWQVFHSVIIASQNSTLLSSTNLSQLSSQQVFGILAYRVNTPCEQKLLFTTRLIQTNSFLFKSSFFSQVPFLSKSTFFLPFHPLKSVGRNRNFFTWSTAVKGKLREQPCREYERALVSRHCVNKEAAKLFMNISDTSQKS